MDTVLNLGMSDAAEAAFIKATGNARFVRDCHRRFIQMYGDVVKGVDMALFEAALASAKAAAGVHHDCELSADALAGLISEFKSIYRRETGGEIPADPREQLREAILGVFRSWNTPRAVAYRRINKITGLLGTAVNVQASTTACAHIIGTRLGAPPSPCRRWCSATRMTRAAAASSSPATRRRARASSTARSSSTPRHVRDAPFSESFTSAYFHLP